MANMVCYINCREEIGQLSLLALTRIQGAPFHDAPSVCGQRKALISPSCYHPDDPVPCSESLVQVSKYEHKIPQNSGRPRLSGVRGPCASGNLKHSSFWSSLLQLIQITVITLTSPSGLALA